MIQLYNLLHSIRNTKRYPPFVRRMIDLSQSRQQSKALGQFAIAEEDSIGQASYRKSEKSIPENHHWKKSQRKAAMRLIPSALICALTFVSPPFECMVLISTPAARELG